MDSAFGYGNSANHLTLARVSNTLWPGGEKELYSLAANLAQTKSSSIKSRRLNFQDHLHPGKFQW